MQIVRLALQVIGILAVVLVPTLIAIIIYFEKSRVKVTDAMLWELLSGRMNDSTGLSLERITRIVKDSLPSRATIVAHSVREALDVLRKQGIITEVEVAQDPGGEQKYRMLYYLRSTQMAMKAKAS